MAASGDAARRADAWVVVADDVARACESALGDDLVGVYVHGSAALGGWAPASDVDVLVVAEAAEDRSWRSLARLLVRAGEVIPVEVSVVSRAAAAEPDPPWPFLLHVATHLGLPRVVPGSTRAGDDDLLMHYAVCRAAGIALCGPEPGETIGEVSRAQVLDYLADELLWSLDHADARYVVLNACRAHAYAVTGRLLSKVDGATWGRAQLSQGDLIRRAERAQRRGVDLGPPDAAVRRLVRDVVATLE